MDHFSRYLDAGTRLGRWREPDQASCNLLPVVGTTIISGPEAQAGRVMIKGRLPGEGPVRLGPVTLLTGKLVTGNPGPGHVAWATVDPVPGSGRVWAVLSELHPQTGLVPVLLGGLRIDSMFPSDRCQSPD